MKFRDLDLEAKSIAQRYKACEKDLLEIIILLDQKKAFRFWGYSSLFVYVTKGLGLSSAVAYNFIAVARKSHEVPALKNQVLSGDLSIHQARKITPVVTAENQKLWLEHAKTQTQKQLEKEVALANPKTAVMEKLNFVAPDLEVKEKVQVKTSVSRVQLQVGVSEKLMIKLRLAQDLESQKKKKNQSLEDTLDALLECYLKKNDPVEKAKRQKVRGKLTQNNSNADAKENLSQDRFLESSEVVSGPLAKSPKRKAIPASIRHQVQLRDQGRCRHRDHQGQRCSSRRYLETHHIKEVANGGQNTLENLITLCSGHHAAQHLSRLSP